MLSSTVLKWFGQSPAAPSIAAKPARVPDRPAIQALPCSSPWPLARLALTDRLWGEGFGFPGGEAEALRLTRSLGLSPATSLLLVGGGGGAACAVARAFGAWVAARENEPELVAAAQRLITRSELNRKVSVAPWAPDQPIFEIRKYHHCMAFEPLTRSQPAATLDALARALKPAGQLVMMDLVADAPLDPENPMVARWATLERRNPAQLLDPAAVTRLLNHVHLDVRIAEDMSERHLEQTMEGWRALVRDMHDRRPDRAGAAYLVAEAELWLLRWRLVKDGRLRMMRWQAISPSGTL
jgi:SAM-dependent methyltransferase